jgi:hypothetical protein
MICASGGDDEVLGNAMNIALKLSSTKHEHARSSSPLMMTAKLLFSSSTSLLFTTPYTDGTTLKNG